jgi:sugar lactone lactonase YvrE
MMKTKTFAGKVFSIPLALIIICTTVGTLLGSIPAACAAGPEAITTVAGNGTRGYSGDGGPATSAMLEAPSGVTVDNSGNLYIIDFKRIRKVDTSGTIATAAGTGISGYSGDGGPATEARLDMPQSVAVDVYGNLYIADLSNSIRKVDTNGVIATIAGNGRYESGINPTFGGYGGDGGPATGAYLNGPTGLAIDNAGNIYFSDLDNYRIRKIDTKGVITTVAGNGAYGYTGDGGPATSAEIGNISSVAVDTSGNLYIADESHQVIRKIDTSGIITTVAGNGYIDPNNLAAGGYSGDGGPATNAELSYPQGLAVDASGNLYIADADNSRIRKVDKSGIISTVAEIYYPTGLALDAAGNLYISEAFTNRIDELMATLSPVLSTGNGQNPIVFAIGRNSYSVDGQTFAMDVAPFILNGRTLVPIRYLADALGAETGWDPSAQAVFITKGTNMVALMVGNSTLTITSIQFNSQSTVMDVAPVIANGRTYLPARYVAEAFGLNVSWDATTQAIKVSQ